jgi:hypothetical protein
MSILDCENNVDGKLCYDCSILFEEIKQENRISPYMSMERIILIAKIGRLLGRKYGSIDILKHFKNKYSLKEIKQFIKLYYGTTKKDGIRADGRKRVSRH